MKERCITFGQNISHEITSKIQPVRKWLSTHKLTVDVGTFEIVGFPRAQPLRNYSFDTELYKEGHRKNLGAQIDTKLIFETILTA